MIELYTFISMIGLGYFLTQPSSDLPSGGTSSTQKTGTVAPKTIINSPSTSPQHPPQHPPLPQGRHVQYDLKRPRDAITIDNTKEMIAEKYTEMPTYLDQYSNKVIPSVKLQNHDNKRIVSKLSGEPIKNDDFIRSDVLPFFGGSMKQSVDVYHSRQLGELIGENQSMIGTKKEHTSFNDLTKGITDVYGNNRFYEFQEARMVPSAIQTNVLPFKQETVGKGLNSGYTSAPTGDLNQDSREYIMRYSTVDELRKGSNPKLSYEARTVDGMKTSMPGYTGDVMKNRVDTYYENNTDRYFVTTPGAYEKATLRAQQTVRNVNKTTTSDREYVGSGYNTGAKNASSTRFEHFENSRRPELSEFGSRNAAKVVSETNPSFDYGKGSIRIYDNERKETLERTYEGNVQSFIKSVTAPLLDALRPTNKEHLVSAAREFGSMNAQLPEKPTTYNKDDVLRTTIKETGIHSTRTASIGNVVKKGTVYDANDVTRTTLKETIVHETRQGHMANSVKKGTVYDPNDSTRVTVKETNIHNTTTGSLAAGTRTYVIDNTDVPKTTLKETGIHDTHEGVLAPAEKRVKVYDPDLVAKTTLRETLENQYHPNVDGHKRSTLPIDDRTKTTLRETTAEMDRDGNIGNVNRQDGYRVAAVDLPHTQKVFLSDKEHYGNIEKGVADGYKTAAVDLQHTVRQFLNDNDHYGGSSSHVKKERVNEAELSVNPNIDKDIINETRVPTLSGVKVNASMDMVNMNPHSHKIAPVYNAETSIDRVYDQGPMSLGSETREKNATNCENDRLDISILKVFKENPYTQSLHSN